MTNISVVKRDGTREPFDANKINLALVKASEGLNDQVAKVVEVASQLSLTLFDGITSEQLDEAVIQTALQNVKDDPDYGDAGNSPPETVIEVNAAFHRDRFFEHIPADEVQDQPSEDGRQVITDQHVAGRYGPGSLHIRAWCYVFFSGSDGPLPLPASHLLRLRVWVVDER